MTELNKHTRRAALAGAWQTFVGLLADVVGDDDVTNRDIAILNAATETEAPVEDTPDAVEPIIAFNFRSTEKPIITRDGDGRFHGIGTFSVAVINRNGVIDATDLFDVMIERFHAGSPVPETNPFFAGIQPRKRLNFHHTALEIGDIDYIARSGHQLIGHFVFDDTPIARAAAQTMANDVVGLWGFSIEYFPDIQADGDFAHERVMLSPEVDIPAFTSGTFHRSSVLKADKAASHFTTQITTRGMNMDAQIKADLIQLLNDTELADLAEQEIDNAENAIVEMVKRATEQAKAKEDNDGAAVRGTDAAANANAEEVEADATEEDENTGAVDEGAAEETEAEAPVFVTIDKFAALVDELKTTLAQPVTVDREAIEGVIGERFEKLEADLLARVEKVEGKVIELTERSAEAKQTADAAKDTAEGTKQETAESVETFLGAAGFTRTATLGEQLGKQTPANVKDVVTTVTTDDLVPDRFRS